MGADVNIEDNDGDTPLLFCEDPETFELLLSLSGNPAHRNHSGEGVFEKALEDENEALLEYLLAKGFAPAELAVAAITRIRQQEVDFDNNFEEGDCEEDLEEDDDDNDEGVKEGGVEGEGEAIIDEDA